MDLRSPGISSLVCGINIASIAVSFPHMATDFTQFVKWDVGSRCFPHRFPFDTDNEKAASANSFQ